MSHSTLVLFTIHMYGFKGVGRVKVWAIAMSKFPYSKEKAPVAFSVHSKDLESFHISSFIDVTVG